MNKEINLEDVLKKQIDMNYPSFGFLEGDEIPYQDAIEAMRECCNQICDLCAENAKLKKVEHDCGGVRAGCKYYTEEIDKDSILNVKNLIK